MPPKSHRGRCLKCSLPTPMRKLHMLPECDNFSNTLTHVVATNQSSLPLHTQVMSSKNFEFLLFLFKINFLYIFLNC
jgi:hypothetical protein